jgi:hypothetical protein
VEDANLRGGHMSTRQWIPIGGLVVTVGIAGYMAAQLHAQASTPSVDFTQAATAQVRDAKGQIVLSGQFAAPVEEDGALERVAVLVPSGVDADATGEAEVEYARTTPREQEVEFSVENVEAGAALTFVIDGTVVATATADRRGRAEVELDVRMPGR